MYADPKHTPLLSRWKKWDPTNILLCRSHANQMQIVTFRLAFNIRNKTHTYMLLGINLAAVNKSYVNVSVN